MFGITYVIDGHSVEPKTRLAAKEFPQTIELRGRAGLAASIRRQPTIKGGEERTRGTCEVKGSSLSNLFHK